MVATPTCRHPAKAGTQFSATCILNMSVAAYWIPARACKSTLGGDDGQMRFRIYQPSSSALRGSSMVLTFSSLTAPFFMTSFMSPSVEPVTFER